MLRACKLQQNHNQEGIKSLHAADTLLLDHQEYNINLVLPHVDNILVISVTVHRAYIWRNLVSVQF